MNSGTGSTAAKEAIQELSLAPKREISILPQPLVPHRQTLCAYVASLYAIGVGFPLDSVKTRQQTYRYQNVWQCISTTYKSEGIGGFYRGITAPLLSTSAVRAVSVMVYSYSLPYTSDTFFSMFGAPTSESSTFERILKTTPGAFFAGSMAGISCTAIAAPFEFTKLVSQIDLLVRNDQKPRSTFQVAKSMIQRNGIKSLYSGFRYHALRDLMGSGLYFTVYDGIKVGVSSMLDSKSHPASIAIAGAMAGTVSWILIYPFDTFKSLVQKDIYSRSLGMERPPRKFSGVFHRKMYRGLGVSLARTSILGMMFFSCYEWLIKTV